MTIASPERANTPAPLAEQLYPGERLLWSGRPPQQRFVGAEVRDIAVGAAMIAAGFVCLNRALALPRHGAGVAAMGLALALLGVLVIVLGVRLKPTRRRRTWYGVTDQRMIVVQHGDFVLSYLLRGLANVALERHRDGTASIRLASTMPRSSRGRTPPAWRAFEHLRDGDDVYRLIHSCAARADRPAAVPTGAPAANPAANPAGRGSNEAVAYGRHSLLDYYEPVRAILKGGEAPVWIARPPAALLLSPADVPQILVTMLATMVLIADAGLAHLSGAHAIAAVLVLYIAARVIADARERRRAWYAVTDRRCVIVTEGKIVEAYSLWPAYVQGMFVRYHGDGRGTIMFLLSVKGWEEMRYRTPHEPRWLTGPCFRWIDDPRTVQDTIFSLLTERPK
jgi:hypothetical protein